MGEGNAIELRRLDKLISDLQWLIFNGGGCQAATTSMLVKALADAQARSVSVSIEHEEEAKEDERKEQAEHAIAVSMAERELALSRSERAVYASFLECEFFTKAMFGKLDHFYTNTWDRLSEDGKSEMSRRVWEGVRRNEYEFFELPESVKSKEAERIERMLVNGEAGVDKVTSEDKTDFLDAQGTNAKYSVLNRKSFAEAMCHQGNSTKAENVTQHQGQLKAHVRSGALNLDEPAQPAASLGNIDLDSATLDALKSAQSANSNPATMRYEADKSPAAQSRN